MKAEPGPIDRSDQEGALFSVLVWRLAVETRAYLGEQVHPEVERMEPRPELARQSIDTLEMLKQKTEGNRSAAESEMLEAVLYELRMTFVQAAKPAPTGQETASKDEPESEPARRDEEPDRGRPGEPEQP